MQDILNFCPKKRRKEGGENQLRNHHSLSILLLKHSISHFSQYINKALGITRMHSRHQKTYHKKLTISSSPSVPGNTQ